MINESVLLIILLLMLLGGVLIGALVAVMGRLGDPSEGLEEWMFNNKGDRGGKAENFRSPQQGN